ncbi:MAG: DEAD/DEAH box helicase, partial [Defluviitaleaceae bacterium]|nr:DEAD/DEAH box helicase [Defluviitaleaceae bacterium]
MNALAGLLCDSRQFIQAKAAVKQGGPVLLSGVVDSQKWCLAAGLIGELGRGALIVAPSELKAKEIYEDMYYFLRDKVYLYPSRDVIFYAADVKSADITRQRFKALEALRGGAPCAIIVSAEALLDRAVPAREFERHIAVLEAGDGLRPEALVARLSEMGYERAPQVEGPGQFALRGGILDIGPTVARCDGALLAEAQAIRLEFFGDEIDSIRVIDSYSQRSVEKVSKAQICPAREFVYDAERLVVAIEKIRREYEETRTGLRRENKRAEASALYETIGAPLEEHSEGGGHPGFVNESFFTFFYEGATSLLDYLPVNSLIFFDEPNRVSAHMEAVQAEYADSVSHRLLSGRLLPSQAGMVMSWQDALHNAAAFGEVLYTSIPQTLRDFKHKAAVEFNVKSCAPLRRRPQDLREDLAQWLDKKYRIVILAGPRRHAQALSEEIASQGLPVRYADDLSGARGEADEGTESEKISPGEALPGGYITVTRGTLTAGFEDPSQSLAVVTDKELFAVDKRRRKRKSRRDKNAAKIQSWDDLRPGDYVVHDNHGVGLFRGIEQVFTEGCFRDYMKLEYSDGGCLYVHTAQMDAVQKYIGGQAQIKLNKLGGADWARAKSRAKGSVKILAEDLIALYAKRQNSEGFVYGPDTVWQSEFESLFPFDETDDQLSAIEDVKRDMESARVMDRLICGDVGYGKTEIAIRAAFKAVQDNKQVAYLVPTTILAQQHYLTFKERMKDYPVQIERLSRFQTKKEQALSVQKLSSGGADIVIGTHRVLSKDVKFQNLGM